MIKGEGFLEVPFLNKKCRTLTSRVRHGKESDSTSDEAVA